MLRGIVGLNETEQLSTEGPPILVVRDVRVLLCDGHLPNSTWLPIAVFNALLDECFLILCIKDGPKHITRKGGVKLGVTHQLSNEGLVGLDGRHRFYKLAYKSDAFANV
jgi:hypothetical protein